MVLAEESFESGKQGIKLDEAQRLCSVYRRLYQSRYYYVYCVFHEKNWTELRIGHGTYKDLRFMGYLTREESDSLSIAGRRSTLWGVYSRQGSLDAWRRSFSQAPVIVELDIPYEYDYEEAHRVYGLRVMGLGLVDPGSPARTVYSSVDLGGRGSGLFASAEDALYACREALAIAGPDDVRYERALVCRGQGEDYGPPPLRNPHAEPIPRSPALRKEARMQRLVKRWFRGSSLEQDLCRINAGGAASGDCLRFQRERAAGRLHKSALGVMLRR